MLDKVKAITDGWINDAIGIKDKDKREEAIRRAKICSTCSFNTGNKCDKSICDIIDGEKICGCGCNLSKKTKSFKGKNKCPKGLW